MIDPIINLFYTKEEAFQFEDSPINTYHSFNGIQLLPFNNEIYSQITNNESGVPLEDWTVNVVDCLTNEKTNITTSFFVIRKFNDIYGKPQIQWTLKEILTDFGYNFVYLEITQPLGQTYYSNVFMITNIDAEKTSHYTYRRYKTDENQSIRLQSWFRQPFQINELTTYFETSTQSTVTKSIKRNLIHKYETETMSFNLLVSFMEIITASYLYVNGIRNSLFEAPEFPTAIGDENFGVLKYSLCPKKWDKLTVLTEKEVPQSLGDFDANDWSENDWLIYDGAQTQGLFNDTFNDKFD